MKPHVICDMNPQHHITYFMENPLEYLESASKEGWINDDDYTIIGALQSIDENEVKEHSEYLCDTYIDDEIANLSGLEAVLPYTVIVAWRYSGIVETLDCNRVSDIIKFCRDTLTGDDSWWTLHDDNGILRVAVEDDVVATFLMIDGDGETHDIGPIVQSIYGYSY